MNPRPARRTPRRCRPSGRPRRPRRGAGCGPAAPAARSATRAGGPAHAPASSWLVTTRRPRACSSRRASASSASVSPAWSNRSASSTESKLASASGRRAGVSRDQREAIARLLRLLGRPRPRPLQRRGVAVEGGDVQAGAGQRERRGALTARQVEHGIALSGLGTSTPPGRRRRAPAAGWPAGRGRLLGDRRGDGGGGAERQLQPGTASSRRVRRALSVPRRRILRCAATHAPRPTPSSTSASTRARCRCVERGPRAARTSSPTRPPRSAPLRHGAAGGRARSRSRG